MKLFSSGNNHSLITLTGFDQASFAYILERLAPLYDYYSPYSVGGCIRQLENDASLGGRPRSMAASMGLALRLAWTRTRGSEYILRMLFDGTHTVYSLFLRFIRRILLKVLAADEYAAVRLPSRNEISAFQQGIFAKYPSLQDVFAVADELKLHIVQISDPVLQNAFSNGWTPHVMADGVAAASRNITIHSNSAILLAGHIEQGVVIVIELTAAFG
ncbi:unnamed protein product [Phytophthora fragariaefolia]|uniref:Unnamed protein product n=1 Tax=Phytophthora fragariaefolia TaxID=1490495 RepID=A0A9W6UEI3_9STRA|nr:unnamed protein product [Phytophthora fragariaefolia]